MQKNATILLFVFLSFSNFSFSQNKAVVLQNGWNNELNNFNPKEFVEKLFEVFKIKLAVKNFIVDVKTSGALLTNEGWEKKLQEVVKEKKMEGIDAYYIGMSTDLRLPAINLGKFLFKNPPRRSKVTFTFHVYDTIGTRILSDTIINRGCVVKTLDDEKGSKHFYSDYNNFMADMLCHLAALRKVIEEMPLTRKQQRFTEAR